MNKMLYCIKHQTMELAQKGAISEFIHSYVEAYDCGCPDYSTQDWCEFDMGLATCPPPEFNMDEFMETVEEPGTDDLDNLVLESVL